MSNDIGKHGRKVMSNCKWPLCYGETLDFIIYDLNATWNDVAGLYIFSFFIQNGWYALYVGQTDSFRNRISNHERLDEAIRRGATHIHSLVVPLAANRNIWLKMLIQHRY